MKRRNVFIGGAVAVAVLVAWVMVVWNPQTKTLNGSKAKADAAEKQVTGLRTELARLKGLQAHSAADQAALCKLDAALPTDPALADLLLQIHSAAVAAGVDEQTIAPAPPVAPTPGAAGAAASGAAAPGSAAAGSAAAGSAAGSAAAGTGAAGATSASDSAAAAKLEQLKLTLSVSGSATQFLDFINRLNGLSRLLVVDTMSLGGGTVGATSSSGKFTGAIQAHAFVRPAAATAS